MIIIGEFITLIKSIAVGFVMCLPIGPISIMVIRKAINFGSKRAFFTGLGSVVADIFYGTIAGAGIALVADFLFAHQFYLQLGAATILLIVSFRMIRRQHVIQVKVRNNVSLVDDFSLGFFLALFNPATLFLMSTLLTAFGVSIPSNYSVSNIIVIIGLLLGELLWWFFLTHIALWARDRFGLRANSSLINIIAGAVLFVLAVLIIIKSVFFH